MIRAIAALVACATLLLTAAGPVAAQEPRSELSGVVSDASSATPIAGASVVLERLAGEQWEPVPDGDLEPAKNWQPTDSAGTYAWNVLPGTYRVRATHAPEHYDSEPSAPMTLPPVEPGPTVANVALTPNPPPTATIQGPAQAHIGQGVTLTADVADDRDVTDLRWNLDADPEFEATGPSATTSFGAPGRYEVGLTVVDAGGREATAPHTVEVVNRLPLVAIAVAPDTPRSGDAVTFTASASDPDGPVVAIEWDLDGDGEYDDALGAQTARAFPAGQHVVRVRVRDAHGGEATAQVTVTVAAVIPPPPVAVAADTSPPALRSRMLPNQRIRQVRRRGLRFVVRCDEPCTVYLEVLVGRRFARKHRIDRRADASVRVGRTTARSGPDGRVVRVRLSRRAARALKRVRRVRLTVQGSAWDAGGYTALLAPRTVTIRRR